MELTRTNRTRLIALATAAIVVAANASQGAYFSQSWGWVALAFLVPVTVALILGVVEAPGRLRAAFAGLMVALGAWIGLSAVWSLSAPASIREVERMLVYVAVALALALLLRRGDAPGLAGGAFAGIVAIAGYGLATRLFPNWLEPRADPLAANRLADPIGYSNGLGLLVSIGVVLGIGLVSNARRLLAQVAAAAAIPLLLATLFFTFSRGAWAALIMGLCVLTALDVRRLQLVLLGFALLPASVVSVWMASQKPALTKSFTPGVDAAVEGRRLAIEIGTLMLISGATVVPVMWARRRLPVQRHGRRLFDAVLLVLLGAGVVLLLSFAGGPTAAWKQLEDGFNAPVTIHDGSLGQRLFSLSGNERSKSITVAWEAAQERPLIGHGSGTYEYLWYERRQSQRVIRDAHSLYAEMLAEVGMIGLALLSLALLVPLVAAVRARRHRFVGAGTGAFVAWAVHSAFDWDWEVVGVTTSALLAAGVGLLAGERRRGSSLAGVICAPLVVFSLLLSAFAVVSLVGNQALFAGRERVAKKEWASAVDHARRAERLLPWSFEPAIVLGDASAGLGDRRAALEAYRNAVSADTGNWVAWLRLAQVARGDERRQAYQRVRERNPRQGELPGEREDVP